MNDLSDALLACEDRLASLDEADALGVVGLLASRAISRRPATQRITTLTTWADALFESVEAGMAAQ
jgi:hypothetical protein